MSASSRILHWISIGSIAQICLSLFLCRVIYNIVLRIRLNATHRKKAAAAGCLPPPARRNKDPFFGIDLLVNFLRAIRSHTALDVIIAYYNELNATTVSFHHMGITQVSSMEPLNLKTVLSTNFKDWGIGEERSMVLSWILGNGIFVSDGAAWQHSRNLLRPAFVRGQVGDTRLFERHSRNLLKAIPRDGETMVDLQPLFFSATLDISSDFLFGRSTGLLDPTNDDTEERRATEAFVDAFTYCQSVIEGDTSSGNKLGFLSRFLPLWIHRHKAKIVHDYVDDIVEQAKKKLEAEKGKDVDQHRYVFLDEILSQTSDQIQIRVELLNILLAGRETTASLLSNIWYEISRRPEVFSKLQSEVSRYFSDDAPITFERLKSLKYLQALMNESLRLYPIVAENQRKAVRDTIIPLGGGPDGKSPVFVSKGSFFHWSIYAMHRRKDLFGEDAELFKPERWLDGEDGLKGLRVGWEYLPFNGGPRICIGQQFALTEAAWLTVRLIQQVKEIESRDEIGQWRERLRITVTGLGGCKVVLTQKDQGQ